MRENSMCSTHIVDDNTVCDSEAQCFPEYNNFCMKPSNYFYPISVVCATVMLIHPVLALEFLRLRDSFF